MKMVVQGQESEKWKRECKDFTFIFSDFKEIYYEIIWGFLLKG